MTIIDLGALAAKDGAPLSYLAQLSRCNVVRDGDALELEAPPDADVGLLVHSIGVLVQRRTRMGGVTHNPWAVGVCCTRGT